MICPAADNHSPRDMVNYRETVMSENMITVNNHMILAAGATDVGRRRKQNEDSLLLDEELGLLIVADGMGGHEAGEVASTMAVRSIREYLHGINDPEVTREFDLDVTRRQQSGDTTMMDSDHSNLGLVVKALNEANHRIFGCNKQRNYPEGTGMGTTVAGLWIAGQKQKATVFHVGDCRIYRFRNGELHQLTRDHTLYQEWQDRGGAGNPPRKNIILRALGPRGSVKPDVAQVEFVSGDKILICSDGLTGMVSDQQIEQIFRHTEQHSLETTARCLIQLANEYGGADNVTVVIAQMV